MYLSNVKMRGHEIKPVKATFEQAKGNCSSSNSKQTRGTPPKAFWTQRIYIQTSEGGWAMTGKRDPTQKFWIYPPPSVAQDLQPASSFSQHVAHHLVPNSFPCSQLSGTSVPWQPRMPEPVLIKDREQMKISPLLTFVSDRNLNACNVRRGHTLI